MSVRADAETLRGIPIFAECDPVQLQLLAFSCERQNFEAGQGIIRQGETGNAAYLILDGQAELQQESGSGTTVIGAAGPGAMLGEVAMIGGVAYSISALAKSPVEAASIPRRLFMRVAEEYPDFGATVLRALARKFALSMTDISSLQGTLDRSKSLSNL
jgi:CRP/FNR family transcriptional regulator, cyclic AMP receptor protein